VQLGSSIPSYIQDAFDKSPLSKTHEFSFQINPHYLQGDFNGDGKLDTAILVKEKSSGKFGIAIFHQGSRHIILLGAGIKFGIWEDGDNFDWMNVWSVFLKGPVERGFEAGRPPKLKGDAILAEHADSASGLIYWNGQQYIWYQQGE
jgi:hypothetical protein